MGEVGNSIEKENMKTGKINFQRSGERKGRLDRKKSRIRKKSSRKKVESEFSRADELVGEKAE